MDDTIATPTAPGVDLAAVVVRGGSVTGRHHRRLDQGSQDAWATARSHAVVVAAVCDGCGSGRRSEIGAGLGAQLWTRAVIDAVASGLDVADPRCWAAARAQVVAALAGLVDAIAPASRDVVVDNFLFTSLVAAVTPTQAAVYAIGDGFVVLDGDVHELGPFADNQPPYLGYDLLGLAPPPSLFLARSAAELASIVLASDGAAELPGAPAADGLAAFAHDDHVVRNPDVIRRRLALINQERVAVEQGTLVRGVAPLGDDTTVVVLRRSAP